MSVVHYFLIAFGFVLLFIGFRKSFQLGRYHEQNRHRHKCPKCNTIWEHGGLAVLVYRAHNCPNCGTEERYIYHDPALDFFEIIFKSR